MSKSKQPTTKVGRNSGTGQFVTKQYAAKHPKTTEVETVKQSKKKS